MTDRSVAIIGSGICGSIAAYHLTRKGIKVHVFEKGPDYPYPHLKPFIENMHDWTNPAYALPSDLMHVTTSGTGYSNDINKERVMLLGGMASVWGAMCHRMHPDDFRLNTQYARGVDWPLTYEELEPHYCEAEQLLGVSGSDLGNPYAAPRTRPYPLPPFEFGYDTQKLQSKLLENGLSLHPSPQARARRAFDGREGCKNFNACEVCPIGARYSPHHHLLQAVSTGLCELHTRVSVRRVLVDKEGRALGVVCRQNDESADREIPFDTVLVAGGAIESARLLLLSTSPRFPNGLGNSGGWVGQNLMFHHIWEGHSHYPEPLYPARTGAEMGYCRQFISPPERAHCGGILVPMRSRPAWHANPNNAQSSSPGRDIVEVRKQIARCEKINLHSESPPDRTKFVGLSSATDRFGDPFAHVQYELSSYDEETFQFASRLYHRFAEASGGIAAADLNPKIFNNGAHHMGTCRMGKDDENSVVDKYCHVHGTQGVYVIGGSNFPNSTAVHPTLTMVALTLHAMPDVVRRHVG